MRQRTKDEMFKDKIMHIVERFYDDYTEKDPMCTWEQYTEKIKEALEAEGVELLLAVEKRFQIYVRMEHYGKACITASDYAIHFDDNIKSVPKELSLPSDMTWNNMKPKSSNPDILTFNIIISDASYNHITEDPIELAVVSKEYLDSGSFDRSDYDVVFTLQEIKGTKIGDYSLESLVKRAIAKKL